MTMELIDTHCHIDVKEFDEDRNQVLQRCQRLGIHRILVPAISRAHWRSLRAICENNSGLYFALGLHPVFLNQHNVSDIADLEKEIGDYEPVAVGEIGLDYFVADLDKSKQQSLFEAQLEIAKNAQLPVVLHVRKAHDQVLSTLKRIKVSGGTCHAFNGSLQQAHQYIDLGFKLGFGGMLTYERSHKLHSLGKTIVLERISCSKRMRQT